MRLVLNFENAHEKSVKNGTQINAAKCTIKLSHSVEEEEEREGSETREA